MPYQIQENRIVEEQLRKLLTNPIDTVESIKNSEISSTCYFQKRERRPNTGGQGGLVRST